MIIDTTSAQKKTHVALINVVHAIAIQIASKKMQHHQKIEPASNPDCRDPKLTVRIPVEFPLRTVIWTDRSIDIP